jgi:hypothetical protein
MVKIFWSSNLIFSLLFSMWQWVPLKDENWIESIIREKDMEKVGLDEPVVDPRGLGALPNFSKKSENYI